MHLHAKGQRQPALQITPALAGDFHHFKRAHHAPQVAFVDGGAGGWIALELARAGYDSARVSLAAALDRPAAEFEVEVPADADAQAGDGPRPRVRGVREPPGGHHPAPVGTEACVGDDREVTAQDFQ